MRDFNTTHDDEVAKEMDEFFERARTHSKKIKPKKKNNKKKDNNEQ